MIVERVSELTGNTSTMDIPVDSDKLRYWEQGKIQLNVQDYFPELTDSQREFIMTGITDDEWADIFPGEEAMDYDDDHRGYDGDEVPF